MTLSIATSARRLELYVRWSMYVSLIVVGLAGFVAYVWGAGGAGLTVLLLVEAAFIVGLNVTACRWSLNRMFDDTPRVPIGFVATWAISVVALTITLWADTMSAFDSLRMMPLLWAPPVGGIAASRRWSVGVGC